MSDELTEEELRVCLKENATKEAEEILERKIGEIDERIERTNNRGTSSRIGSVRDINGLWDVIDYVDDDEDDDEE